MVTGVTKREKVHFFLLTLETFQKEAIACMEQDPTALKNARWSCIRFSNKPSKRGRTSSSPPPLWITHLLPTHHIPGFRSCTMNAFKWLVQDSTSSEYSCHLYSIFISSLYRHPPNWYYQIYIPETTFISQISCIPSLPHSNHLQTLCFFIAHLKTNNKLILSAFSKAL